MFGLQARAARRLAPSARPGTADVTDVWLLVARRRCSSCSAGFFAGAEAALSRVSRVARRRAARARAVAARTGCSRSLADPARYLNLLILLRVACRAGRHRARHRRVRSTASTTTWQAVLVAGRRRWSSCPTSRSASRRAPSAASTPAPVALRGARFVLPAGPGARPAAAAADPGRQRAHARQGLPRGPVRLRGRAARPGRPRRGEPAHRGPRAGDDPLGLRAGRHDRPRGHGAAHRHGLHRARPRRCARRCRSRCAAASPASRWSARASTTWSASPTSRTSSRRTYEHREARVDRAGRVGHAPGRLRAGEQAGRRAAARDAGPADPHGDRRRRVRRHRRAGHHRGRARGDRRRDHRRVRRGGPAGRASCPTAPCGSAPGCTSTSWPSASTSSSRTTTSTPSAACSPSTWAGCRSPGAQVVAARPRAHRRERAGPAQPDRHGARTPGRRRAGRRAAGGRRCPRRLTAALAGRGRQAGDAGPGGPGPRRRAPRAPPCATTSAAPTPRRSVDLPSLRLTALQAAVAAAVSSGSDSSTAACVVGDGRRSSRTPTGPCSTTSASAPCCSPPRTALCAPRDGYRRAMIRRLRRPPAAPAVPATPHYDPQPLDGVETPYVLRFSAAWSWRLLLVVAAVYVFLRCSRCCPWCWSRSSSACCSRRSRRRSPTVLQRWGLPRSLATLIDDPARRSP